MIVYDSRWQEGQHTDVSTVASYMGQGSVDVYSLSQPPVRGVKEGGAGNVNASLSPTEASAVQPLPTVTAPHDSSVTIFPFEAPARTEYRGGLPPLMPPSQVYPSMNSPFPVDVKSMPVPPATLTPPPPSFPKERILSGPGEQSSLYFKHNRTGLNGANKDKLQTLARAYEGAANYVLKVEGHASTKAEVQDPVERRIANLRVSMKRAMNVSQALIRDGVPAASIQTVAIGDARPALAQNNMTGEQASRRVEIYSFQSF